MKQKTLPRQWFAAAVTLAESIVDGLFHHPNNRFHATIAALWIAGLFAVGGIIWGVFYNWGNIPFDFLDWAEVTGPRYALLQDAATRGVFPLHAGNTTALRLVTDRYLAIPDTPISPQFLLLRYMEMGRYIFLDTMLFYAIGFIGLLFIYRKYRLSPFVFAVLFFIFSFNGYITAHFSVGHSIWTGYFLLPFFALLVLNLVEQQSAGWKWVLGLCAVFVLMLLQGAFHFFIWCLMFLGLLALANPRLLKPVVTGGFFAVLTALPRLLPPATILEGITHEYLGGFATLTELFGNMIVLRDPDRAITVITNTFRVNYWEVDYFIGLLGLAVLVIFGIAVPLWQSQASKSVVAQILLPSLVIAALSLGKIYWVLIKIAPIPPFTGERVTSRMLIVPLIFVMILAAQYLQREFDRRAFHTIPLVGFLVLLAVLAHDLFQHAAAWYIRYLDGLVHLFPKVPFDPAQHTLNNHPDPLYTAMLVGGALVSALAFAFLIAMTVRERRRKFSPPAA